MACLYPYCNYFLYKIKGLLFTNYRQQLFMILKRLTLKLQYNVKTQSGYRIAINDHLLVKRSGLQKPRAISLAIIIAQCISPIAQIVIAIFMKIEIAIAIPIVIWKKIDHYDLRLRHNNCRSFWRSFYILILFNFK